MTIIKTFYFIVFKMKKIWLLTFFVFFSFFLSFSFSFWQTDCPYWLVDDPYPGKCGRYVDQNGDNLCDLSQTWIEDENQIEIWDPSCREVWFHWLSSCSPIIIENLYRNFYLSVDQIISILEKQTWLEINQKMRFDDLLDQYWKKISFSWDYWKLEKILWDILDQESKKYKENFIEIYSSDTWERTQTSHQESSWEHKDDCDVWLWNGELSSSEMKAMTVSQIAIAFWLSEQETINRLSQKTNLEITGWTNMQWIHDQAELPMKEVRTLLSSQIVEEKPEKIILEDKKSFFDNFDFSRLKFMFPIAFLAWILIAFFTYIINKTLWQKTFFSKLFCCVDSNISLLVFPIFFAIRYMNSQYPSMFGGILWYIAFWLLYLLLISRPIMNLLQKSKIKNSIFTKFMCRFVCHRKQFGIIMFWFVWLHSFIYLNMWFRFWTLWERILTWAWFSGLIALITFFVWYITSNTFAMKKLKTYRKPVQRLAYLWLILSVVHVTFISLERGIVLRILTVIWGVLWFLARKK